MSVKAPSEQNVGYLLKRAQHAFRAEMDRALESHELTAPQYAVLAALENDQGNPAPSWRGAPSSRRRP